MVTYTSPLITSQDITLCAGRAFAVVIGPEGAPGLLSRVIFTTMGVLGSNSKLQ